MASQHNPIVFPTLHRDFVSDAHLRLIDTQLQFSPGHVNDFSPIVGVFMTVTECLVELVCNGNWCSYLQEWERYCDADDEQMMFARHRVTALVLWQANDAGAEQEGFLLLEPYGTRDSAYIRIGYGRIDYRSRRDYSTGIWDDPEAKLAPIKSRSETAHHSSVLGARNLNMQITFLN
jgi:hypothetical protein